MDWFSWLSKTGLDRSLIYEYTLSFSRNQLEEEDLPYLNHEFLQSMGIQIAKHRLEILKLARKQHKFNKSCVWSSIRRPLSKLIIAVKKTKKNVSKRIRLWVRPRKDHHHSGGRGRGAVVVRSSKIGGSSRRSLGGGRSIGSIGSSSRWKAAMLKRSQRFTMAVGNSQRMTIKNGSFRSINLGLSSRIDSFSSSIIAYDHVHEADQDGIKDHEEFDDYWSTPYADNNKLNNPMVHNIKPT